MQAITLGGTVSGLAGTCPAVTFTIEGRTVTTSGSTTFKRGNCAKLTDGDTVGVRGLLTLEGTVNATEVDLDK